MGGGLLVFFFGQMVIKEVDDTNKLIHSLTILKVVMYTIVLHRQRVSKRETKIQSQSKFFGQMQYQRESDTEPSRWKMSLSHSPVFPRYLLGDTVGKGHAHLVFKESPLDRYSFLYAMACAVM